ncbi:Hypothetical predicted protein [Paramuricea clavata]|uniref:Uncharacterized protein n=1 Tax=Paramuricea clavata TaxID=317549 RepID=A0A6S7FIU6_PARCT|nr:Hypothetical predicted protein [Paramuricea clavata]
MAVFRNGHVPIFPTVSRSRVRLWLINSKIETLYPTPDERRVFKEANPQVKSSVFGLIREQDLKRLMNEKVEKPRAKVARRIDCPSCPPKFASDPPKLVAYSDGESSEDDDGAIAIPKATLSRPTLNTSNNAASSSPQNTAIVETAIPTSSKKTSKVVAVSSFTTEFPTPPSSRGTSKDGGDDSTPQSGKDAGLPTN